MFGGIGTLEIVVVVLLIVLLFDKKEISRIVRSVAQTWRKMQRAAQDVQDEMRDIIDKDDDLSG